MPETCPVCGQPSDGWPLDLCQDHWEAYIDETYFVTEAGLLPLPDGFNAEWIAQAKAAQPC